MKIVIKFLSLVLCIGSLYVGSSFFLKGMVRYNALLLFVKANGKRKWIANAAILIWFADAFVIFWLIELLSVANDQGIHVLVRNAHLFTVQHLTELPNKVITKTWWRSLRTRKPAPLVMWIMKGLAALAVFHFARSYFTVVGSVVWQLGFGLDFCKKTRTCVWL